ncbi:MAG TPA: hypothetical protein VG937_29715 [Polyangiaceae bacterium]|nr:hypothetical protein [Polyangiaceae bacterium]
MLIGIALAILSFGAGMWVLSTPEQCPPNAVCDGAGLLGALLMMFGAVSGSGVVALGLIFRVLATRARREELRRELSGD